MGRRIPRSLLVGVIGIWLVCWPPAQWLFSQPLESPYPVHIPPLEDAGAIVVFGSSVRYAAGRVDIPLPDASSYHRSLYAAWLYRKRAQEW